MNKSLIVGMAISLVLLTGCSTVAPETDDTQVEEVMPVDNRVSSTNAVTMSDGDEVGESILERTADGIVLNVEACCMTPGNAYTVWWLIGDVELSMTNRAIESELAIGFVADSEQVDLELILNAGTDGIEDPNDGVRIVVLDHGPDIGDPKQITTPEGGCTGMCPVLLRTSHAAP